LLPRYTVNSQLQVTTSARVGEKLGTVRPPIFRLRLALLRTAPTQERQVKKQKPVLSGFLRPAPKVYSWEKEKKSNDCSIMITMRGIIRKIKKKTRIFIYLKRSLYELKNACGFFNIRFVNKMCEFLNFLEE
jgi:hypothetical protein